MARMPDDGSDDPVAANKLSIKTGVKCDLGPSSCCCEVYLEALNNAT